MDRLQMPADIVGHDIVKKLEAENYIVVPKVLVTGLRDAFSASLDHTDAFLRTSDRKIIMFDDAIKSIDNVLEKCTFISE